LDYYEVRLKKFQMEILKWGYGILKITHCFSLGDLCKTGFQALFEPRGKLLPVQLYEHVYDTEDIPYVLCKGQLSLFRVPMDKAALCMT